MAIAFVNSTGATGGGDLYTDFPLPAFEVTAGNAIVVGVSNYTSGSPRAVQSISDTALNSYTRCGNAENGDANHTMELWVATNVAGDASNIITVHMSGAAAFLNAGALQYSGLAPASAYDAAAALLLEGGTSTTHSTNTLSTNQNTEVVVGFFATWDLTYAYSASAPHAVRYANAGNSFCLADQIVGAMGSYDVTVSTALGTTQVSIARSFRGLITTISPGILDRGLFRGIMRGKRCQ